MNGFYVAAGAIAPMFIIIIFGYILKCTKVFTKEFILFSNQMCFKIFIPVLLFYNIYTTDLKALFNLSLFVFVGVSLLILFIALWIVVVKFEKNNLKRGVLIQGIMRSNFVVLGIPIINNIFGPGNTGVVGVLLSIVLPMYNILSVIALEYFSFQDKEESKGIKSNGFIDKKMWKNIAYQVVTNNLIIASVLAYLLFALNINLPSFFMKAVSDIAAVATGFSLLILGASFQIRSVRENMKQLAWAVIARLIIIPSIFLTTAVLLGFRGLELASLVPIFAAPTSVSSFSMTQIIGGDDDLSANIIVFSSLFSMFSLFVIIYILEMCKLL